MPKETNPALDLDAVSKKNLWLVNCYFAHTIIPYDSPPGYHSAMRHFVALFIHLITILTQVLQPGGVCSFIAESLLLKHQLPILIRSLQRSPTLSSSDETPGLPTALFARQN